MRAIPPVPPYRPLTADMLDGIRQARRVSQAAARCHALIVTAGALMLLATLALLAGTAWLVLVDYTPWVDRLQAATGILAVLALAGLAVGWRWQHRLALQVAALRRRGCAV